MEIYMYIYIYIFIPIYIYLPFEYLTCGTPFPRSGTPSSAFGTNQDGRRGRRHERCR